MKSPRKNGKPPSCTCTCRVAQRSSNVDVKFNFIMAHPVAGYSLQNGSVLLDISGLNGLQVLDQQAMIGAGIKLGPLYLGLYQHGNRAFPAGVCPAVGTGGHLLGKRSVVPSINF